MVNNNADDYANARINMFFPGFPSTLTGQCVSLIKWYIGEMCGVNDWQSARGDAKNFGDTLVRQGLAFISSSPIRGDIAVWKKDGGGYGHIGIVCSDGNIFEENAAINGTASENVPDGDGGYTKVFASRLDSINAAWRIGSPIFYRMYRYKEINNEEEDMLTPTQIDMVFKMGFKQPATESEYMNPDYQKSAGLTIETVWNNGGEAAYNNAAVEEQKSVSLVESVSDLTTRLDESQTLNKKLQDELDAKTTIISIPTPIEVKTPVNTVITSDPNNDNPTWRYMTVFENIKKIIIDFVNKFKRSK